MNLYQVVGSLALAGRFKQACIVAATKTVVIPKKMASEVSHHIFNAYNPQVLELIQDALQCRGSIERIQFRDKWFPDMHTSEVTNTILYIQGKFNKYTGVSAKLVKKKNIKPIPLPKQPEWGAEEPEQKFESMELYDEVTDVADMLQKLKAGGIEFGKHVEGLGVGGNPSKFLIKVASYSQPVQYKDLDDFQKAFKRSGFKVFQLPSGDTGYQRHFRNGIRVTIQTDVKQIVARKKVCRFRAFVMVPITPNDIAYMLGRESMRINLGKGGMAILERVSKKIERALKV